MAKKRDTNRRSKSSRFEKGFTFDRKPHLKAEWPAVRSQRTLRGGQDRIKKEENTGATVRVECMAEYKAEEEPRFVHLDGERFAVLEILKRWREPGGFFFRIQLVDGPLCVLRYDPASDTWVELGRDQNPPRK